tara:strand:- start:2137 stop:2883 length:747 start_codon:yes stop_codon:yes gene_type:complete
MTEKEFLIVIPARYKSTRLPGKPLIDICGKPMIVRTYEQCIAVAGEENVIVATDDLLVGNECNNYNINWVMTDESCLTGTDRVCQVASKIKASFYINVQGDEPLIDPSDITKMIIEARKDPLNIFCGFAKITNEDDYFSPNCPKVVMSLDQKLLYMSRSPIPGNKEGSFRDSFRQICIYSFPRERLLEFSSIGKKSPIEKVEDIEILRFLEMGLQVRMVLMSGNSIPVDVPEDLAAVKKIILENGRNE